MSQHGFAEKILGKEYSPRKTWKKEWRVTLGLPGGAYNDVTFPRENRKKRLYLHCKDVLQKNNNRLPYGIGNWVSQGEKPQLGGGVCELQKQRGSRSSLSYFKCVQTEKYEKRGHVVPIRRKRGRRGKD